MYKSPIHIIESTMDSFAQAIVKQKDDAIFAEIQHSFGVDLDRGELIRALQYDRDQYEKGYADGKRDAINDLVRCKDCRWARPQDHREPTDTPKQMIICQCFMNHHIPAPWGARLAVNPEHFCSYGERRD